MYHMYFNIHIKRYHIYLSFVSICTICIYPSGCVHQYGFAKVSTSFLGCSEQCLSARLNWLNHPMTEASPYGAFHKWGGTLKMDGLYGKSQSLWKWMSWGSPMSGNLHILGYHGTLLEYITNYVYVLLCISMLMYVVPKIWTCFESTQNLTRCQYQMRSHHMPMTS